MLVAILLTGGRNRCVAAWQDDGPDQGSVTEANPAHALVADVRMNDGYASTPAMRSSRSMTAVYSGNLPGESSTNARECSEALPTRHGGYGYRRKVVLRLPQHLHPIQLTVSSQTS